MFIEFQSVNIDPDDLLVELGLAQPTVEIPVSVRTTEVIRFESSVHGESYTDVFLMDGDLLTANIPYEEFKKTLKCIESINKPKSYRSND